MRDYSSYALPLSILVLAAAIAWSAMPAAQAEGPAPSTVVCASAKMPPAWTTWVTEQVALGRSHFVSPTDGMLCTW